MVEINVSFASITPQALQLKNRNKQLLANLQESMQRHILLAGYSHHRLNSHQTSQQCITNPLYYTGTDSLGNPFSGYLRFENVKHFRVNCQQVRITRWKIGGKRSYCRNNLPSCPELWRCSPRSQPNTLSLRMPRCRSFWGGGRDFIKVLRNVTSFPCFLHTD